jgi:hypothetical protein
MKKLFAVMPTLSATLFSTPGAAARTAAELERVLALPPVSYGDTAWLVPGAAEAPITLLRTLTPTVRYSIINMLYCLLSQGDSMNTKSLYQKNSSIIIGLPVLLCAAALSALSCDLPGRPDFGTGSLTLLLPETSAQGAASQRAPVQNTAAGVSRSVLPDRFTGTLTYRVTLSGPGETQTLEAGGGGTTVSLDAGQWTVEAAAYDPGNPSVTVGSGSAVITVVAGQSSSVRIPMKVDPAYEALLTEIYIHNEAELRRIGTDFAIDGSVNFYLERDIVITQPWTPVGNGSNPFKAVFDGQGHTITIKSFGGPGFPVKELGDIFVYQGFFASVEDAQIKNTTIKYDLSGPADIRTGDGSVYSDPHAGGVAGRADNTSFENVRVIGNLSIIADGDSALSVGGIAGQVESGTTITDCHVTGTVGGTSTEKALNIGGIAGSSMDSPITGSSFTGNITGSAPLGNCDAGGIAGHAGGEITGCFAQGHIKAEADSPRVGGIAGYIAGSSIKKSYAAGVIEGIGSTDSNSGGIVGYFNGDSPGSIIIEDCYALADVSSSSTGGSYYPETLGGIVGFHYGRTYNGTISKCYAAGTVKSNGQNPDIYVGGIVGQASESPLISGCMALVLELDGGTSTSPSKTVHKIAYTTTGSLSGNYARNDMTVSNQTNTPSMTDPRDGMSKPLADFTSQALYTTAGWNFTTGTGDWKFISGYDYPVLSWQTTPPQGLAVP